MEMSEKNLIRTLLFYSEMLSDKRKSEEFQKEMENLGLTFDYYVRAMEQAREYLNK
jgi:hypothetical protein